MCLMCVCVHSLDRLSPSSPTSISAQYDRWQAMWQIHLFCAASKLWCALMVLIISGPLLLCVPPLITSYCSFFFLVSGLGCMVVL